MARAGRMHMIDEMLKLSSITLIVLGVCLLFAAVRTRRVVRARGEVIVGRRPSPSASEEREMDAWIQVELDRAWSLIESRDESEVLAGLQILTVLGSSIIHLHFFRRLLALTQHTNVRVAEHAQLTVRKVARPSEGS